MLLVTADFETFRNWVDAAALVRAGHFRGVNISISPANTHLVVIYIVAVSGTNPI